MKDYLITVMEVRTYEIVVSANDDEQIFRYNDSVQRGELPHQLVKKIDDIAYYGKLIEKNSLVSEVIEGI